MKKFHAFVLAAGVCAVGSPLSALVMAAEPAKAPGTPQNGAAAKDAKPVPARPRQFKPPTLEKMIEAAMREKKPLNDQLQSDLTDARLFENYVLVVAGPPKSEACRRFFSIVYRRDGQAGGEDARNALLDFTRLAVDASAPERAAELKTFLARWNLTVPAPDDALFAVIDTEGHLVTATTGKKLWADQKTDAKVLTALLKDHAPPMPDAQKRLKDALAKAKRENKRVFVEQSASWCGWCHVLAKFLDQHRSLVEKDYVWITIDPRFAHGEEVIKKLRPKQEGGIPWVVILDADGNALINSDGPEGNIGYPGSPQEIEHFGKMLRTTIQHMSDAEIKILLADALLKK
jgi:hypothetical protein